MSTLLRVTTPTACGGLVIEPGPDGAVTTAAPFLEDFLGLTEFEVYADCNDRGWHVEILPVDPLAPDLLGTRATVQPEREFVHRLEGLLWPERFPPGHARHDPDHVFWSGHDDHVAADDWYEPYQWDADTIEWVSDLVTKELEKVRAPEPEPSRAMHPRHAWESHRIQLEGQDEPLLLWQCSDCGATRWKGREDNEKAGAPCEGPKESC